MTKKPREITLEQFSRYFVEDMRDGRFCFILGAGASKSSKIRTGAELAHRWLTELKEDLGSEFDHWAKAEKIDENDCARYYPKIFTKRFEADKQAGHAYLERAMRNAEPSCGYLFLAGIMAQGRHNIVITTNFDSLTESALFIVTPKKPLIIGHSSLADFINVPSERPQIIKAHHDLFLSPQSTDVDTREIADSLKTALKKVFEHYTPVVIGYGGNDGGFMNVLKESLDNQILWCYKGDALPRKDIMELVADKDGSLVPIDNFDELMVRLGNKMGLGRPDEYIDKIAKKRITKYRTEMERVNKTLEKLASKRAMLGIAAREGENWWSYELQAQQATDIEAKENIYKEGLEKFPSSHELMNNYANFLIGIKKDHAEAEGYYRKALELAPEDADINGNYASFLKDVKKDHAEAEGYYRKALELAPEDADINVSYAIFLSDVRKDHAEAEGYYRKALELAPEDANINGNYANFLIDVRKDHAGAGRHYRKALELAPEDANINGNYANFLSDVKKDHAEAEGHYRKALELAPEEANINVNYASFLSEVKKDHAEAEGHYRKALELAPEDVDINVSYAIFLSDVKKDHAGADRCFRKALELAPEDANANVNYACLLLLQGQFPQAREFIDKAFEYNQNPKNEDLELGLWFYLYACFYPDYPDSKQELKRLLDAGVRSPNWNLNGVVEKAGEMKHPEYEKVVEFARRISDDAP